MVTIKGYCDDTNTSNGQTTTYEYDKLDVLSAVDGTLIEAVANMGLGYVAQRPQGN